MPNYRTPRGTFGLELVKGLVPGNGQSIHKFGRNLTVGTNFEPVSPNGIFMTPQVSGATALRIKAGNANDTAAGTGARSIYIEGLNADGDFVSETLVTAGTSASANSTNTYIRLYRAYVATSGTYASTAGGSHSADITIENSAGTSDWTSIESNSFPRGQGEIAAYTVAKGRQAFLTALSFGADDKTKIVELVFFKREGILDTAAPYQAMRTVFTLSNPGNSVDRLFAAPIGPFPALTDIGVMVKVDSGSTEVHCDFQLIILDE